MMGFQSRNYRIHYENTPIQVILKIFPPKTKKKNQMKNSDIFLISAQKHRLWVFVEAVLTSTHNRWF